MRTRFVLTPLLVLSLVWGSTYAQTEDDLVSALQQAQQVLRTPDSALALLKDAPSKEAPDTLRAEFWRTRGLAHYYSGAYDSAVFNLDMAKRLVDSAGCNSQFFKVSNGLAVILHSQGLIVEAIPHYTEALECAEQRMDTLAAAKVYNNLGVLYRDYGMYDLAIRHTRQSYAIHNQLNQTAEMAGTLNNMGQIHMAEGNLDSAQLCFAQSIAWKQEAGDQRGLANSFNNLGLVHFKRSHYQKAAEAYENAKSVRQEIGDFYGVASAAINLAEVYIQLGAFDQARAALDEADSLNKQINALEISSRYWLQMAALADTINDHQNAVTYLNEHLQVRDKIRAENNEQEQLRIQRSAAINEMLINAHKSRDQQASKEAIILRQRTINLVLAIGIAVFIGLLSLFIYQLKQLTELRNQLMTDRDTNRRNAENRKNALTRISHEIRTPVQGIMTLSQMLRSDKPDAREIQSVVGAIQESGSRLLHNVNNLMHFARVEEGEFDPVMKEHNLLLSMNEVLADFEERVAQKELKVQSNHDPNGTLSITTDRTLLDYTLVNLLDNAIKFTPVGGEIRVLVDDRTTEVMISVADSGNGMDSWQLEQVFTPFYHTNGENKQATGLGLFIALRYAEALGGTLEVESKKGQGTTFRLTLPKIN